jgi:transcriptional regulator with XRE-family HTH domain
MSLLLKQRRLVANMTQQQLAERSNVSLAVLRKFERTGKISLESFIKLAFILGVADAMLETLKIRREAVMSLDDLLKEEVVPKRKRAYSRRKEK